MRTGPKLRVGSASSQGAIPKHGNQTMSPAATFRREASSRSPYQRGVGRNRPDGSSGLDPDGNRISFIEVAAAPES